MVNPSRFTPAQLTRFAKAVVSSLQVPIVILDQRFRVLGASPSFCRLLTDGSNPHGKELLSLDNGRWNVTELRQALEVLLPEHRSFDDVVVPGTSSGTVFVSGRALYTDEGAAELINLSVELAPSKARTAEQLEAGLAVEIVATIREPLLVLDYEHQVQLANDAFYRAFRVAPADVVGKSLNALGGRQWDIPQLRDQLQALLTRDRFFQDLEVEHEFPQIGRRTMLLNARRIDHLRLILLAMEDVTERRRNERQQEMLVSELAHRVHNTLAIVQSLAMQTIGETVDGFRSAFLGRLRALATAHDILFESRWRKAELDAMLRQILAPHTGNAFHRVSLDGPSVNLSATQAVGVALIIHELATNAAKYGAFSTESGHVSVTWGSKSAKVWLEWRESGGPPVQPAPSTNFGVKLIERTASYQLAGHAKLAFERSGLSCRLEFPMESVGSREP